MAQALEQFDRSGISATGRAITPPEKLPICVEVVGAPVEPPLVVDRDVLVGCDDTGQEIHRVTVTYDDGNTVTTDVINGVPQVTLSPSFTANKANTESDSEIAYATNTTNGDAEFGRVVEVSRQMVKVDGVLDPAQTTYWNMNVQPPVDVTALVTVAPFQLAAAPVRKQLVGENLDVTGAVGVALAAIPTFATYAEVYIDASADDTGIRWAKDGSAPADDNGEQDNVGGTIRLLDRDEIDGFLALTLDGNGTLDPALTASLTVNYWNVAPDED